jgi:two-component system response regulator AtoC
VNQSSIVSLVVDPEPSSARTLVEILGQLGGQVFRTATGAEALERFHTALPSLIFLDVDITDIPGRHLLRHFRSYADQTPIIALARRVDVWIAVELVRAGATEVVEKGVSRDALRLLLEKVLPSAMATGRPEAPDRGRVLFFSRYEGLFRRSERMKAVEALVMRVADTDGPVLIQGEPGTGKELVAQAIHYLSGRSGKPWQRVNCASLPGDLLESEIFGFEGEVPANSPIRQPGKLDLADGGTLLLDEIADIPPVLQARIVHLLQDGQFFRARGRDLISTGARLLATTARDLKAMTVAHAYREDLYRLLGVVNIVVPPLRERREEIPLLADDFRVRFAGEFSRLQPKLSSEILELLSAYDWPGNVRELENLVKRWIVLGDDAHVKEELHSRLRARGGGNRKQKPASIDEVGLREVARRAARAAERAALRDALERVGGNRAAAARLLKISYKTLLQKLNEGKRAERPGGQG